MATEFKFTDPHMQEMSDKLKKSMADVMKLPIDEIQCKGVRIYYVHQPTDTMMCDGMYVDNFDPDEYTEESDTQ